MKLKIALFGATALGMLMATGVVYAGDNNSAITLQTGPGDATYHNTLSIDQSGATNSQVGAAVDPDHYFTQQGTYNYATIVQHNDSNGVGLAGSASYGGLGVNQSQSGNYLAITQGYNTGGYGHATVGGVQQSAGASLTAFVNQATITQGWWQKIGAIQQTYISGGANVIAVTQTGSNTTTLNNYVMAIAQKGGGNSASFTMNNSFGAANGIGIIDPISAAGIAMNNGALAEIIPVATALTGVVGAAPSWTISEATITQNGQGNQFNVNMNGAANLYGFLQDNTVVGGSGNSIGGSISGIGNSVVVAQPFTGGGGVTLAVAGNDNDVGVQQFGYGDLAGVTTGGGSSGNHTVIMQLNDLHAGLNTASSILDGADNISVQVQANITGGKNNSTITAGANANSNTLAAAQVATGGGSNTANIGVVSGANNTAVVGQYTAGGVNQATVSITGSNNNNSLTFAKADSTAVATTEGTLGMLAGGNASPLYAALNGLPEVDGHAITALNVLTPGLMSQFGSNTLGVTVTGDDNLFSTYQNGSGNAISSTIGSSGNELAIAQIGNNNSATTSQNGAGNSIGMIQVNGTNNATINQ